MFHQQNQHNLPPGCSIMGPASVFRAEYKTPNNITQHNTTTHTQLHHTIHIKVEAGSGESREQRGDGDRSAGEHSDLGPGPRSVVSCRLGDSKES